MVLPARAWASNRAATAVPATANWTRNPRSPASRTTSCANRSGAPNMRARPLASNTTATPSSRSTRGEHARATASSAPGAGDDDQPRGSE